MRLSLSLNLKPNRRGCAYSSSPAMVLIALVESLSGGAGMAMWRQCRLNPTIAQQPDSTHDQLNHDDGSEYKLTLVFTALERDRCRSGRYSRAVPI